ncbi:MAG TPA: 4-oxalocrotonate tautomerase DmpI [Methanospirillum sp.]|uniref:4-oxalocrotonate tautomerase DmpI n=1 Tax=Methanospirillum sp. TaxID=45200 RepID=UPI002B619D1E|nr:4-oxalocrotonate tautomerase DmpI [Methanospirillum sp.]HWQ63134.1 4-oxalocrotonate tautomerase DmpI [Methanospirillum sp.]
MPVITIDLWPISPEIKTELIQKLTKTASDITNLPQSTFFVYVREYPTDSIGVGGIPLSQLNLPQNAGKIP